MDITKKLYTAIINLKSTAELNVSGYVETEEDFNKIQWLQADKTWSTTNPHSEITWSTLSTEMTRLQTEYDGIGLVQRNRANEYPSIPDQLDDIFHNGVEGWKTSIQVIKTKYPKG